MVHIATAWAGNHGNCPSQTNRSNSSLFFPFSLLLGGNWLWNDLTHPHRGKRRLVIGDYGYLCPGICEPSEMIKKKKRKNWSLAPMAIHKMASIIVEPSLRFVPPQPSPLIFSSKTLTANECTHSQQIIWTMITECKGEQTGFVNSAG